MVDEGQLPRRRGRPRTDPNKLDDEMVTALESLMTKGLIQESKAIRAFIQWQGKAYNEATKTNRKIIEELSKRVSQAEGRGEDEV